MTNRLALSTELINKRLKDEKVPVRLWQRGDRLSLRATLPCSDGSAGKKQQPIALGVTATNEGLRYAQNKAYELGIQISTNTFSWDKWTRTSKKYKTVAAWLERFEKHYLAANPDCKPTTWEKHWKKAVFDRLPPTLELNETLILELVLSTDPNTRARKQTCQKLQRLADFAGLNLSLSDFQGSYGPSQAKERFIPSNEEILAFWDEIPNEQWQAVYGLLACFGLRPHEAFHCEFIDSITLKVLEGKTGDRISRALAPEWAQEWDLLSREKPAITWRTYQEIGQRVNRQLSRYKMPWTPYALRHAWCIRGSVQYRIPSAVMAQMAGHSPTMHLNIYQRWISDDLNEATYRKIVLGED